jgi:hypothetical protein
MNKTQLLSDTENLIYCTGKTLYIETGMVLDTANGSAQVSGRGRQDCFFLSNRKILHASFL